jgi:hypothetical protein
MTTKKDSHIYKVRSISDQKSHFQLKVYKKCYMKTHPDKIEHARSEMKIYDMLKHENIVKIVEHGELGLIKNKDSEPIQNLFYVLT